MSPQHLRASIITTLAFCAAALLLGLLWLLLPSPALFAQNQPEALGSISGVVRNEQGDPLPNINVSLYAVYLDINGLTRATTTDGQGAYELVSIPPGVYKIQFKDTKKIFATKFYVNGIVLDEGAVVNVSGNQVTGIDMELAPAGVISVTVAPAVPTTAVPLSFYLFVKKSNGRWSPYETLSWSDPTSNLAFSGLPSASYRLCAQFDNLPIYSNWNECYANSFFDSSGTPPADATDIVIEGVMQKTVTFTFGDLSQLQGIVQSKSGKPLADIEVKLTDLFGNMQTSVVSNAQGHFQFDRINEGEYLLQAADPTHAYLASYSNSNGVTEAEKAKHFYITSSSRYSQTLTMQQSGSITGLIRLEGGGIPWSTYVVALKPFPPGDNWWEAVFCTSDFCTTTYEPATGAYTITGLTTGRYRILAADYSGLQNALKGYYGSPDLQKAQDVAVIAGKTTPNINVTLAANAYAGTIQGRATADGVPVAGIEVGLFGRAFEETEPASLHGIDPAIVTTSTNSQGSYRFDGLAKGTYLVGFRDPNSKYALIFYGGGYLSLAPVTLADSMTITGIDVALTLGGTIYGRVRRGPGKNPAEFRIHAELAQENGSAEIPFLDVLTDVNGNYEIKSLPPGRYYVSAISPNYEAGVPPARYYPGVDNAWEAETIEVGPGEVITGIDILEDALQYLYLPNIGTNATDGSESNSRDNSNRDDGPLSAK